MDLQTQERLYIHTKKKEARELRSLLDRRIKHWLRARDVTPTTASYQHYIRKMSWTCQDAGHVILLSTLPAACRLQEAHQLNHYIQACALTLQDIPLDASATLSRGVIPIVTISDDAVTVAEARLELYRNLCERLGINYVEVETPMPSKRSFDQQLQELADRITALEGQVKLLSKSSRKKPVK